MLRVEMKFENGIESGIGLFTWFLWEYALVILTVVIIIKVVKLKVL